MENCAKRQQTHSVVFSQGISFTSASPTNAALDASGQGGGVATPTLAFNLQSSQFSFVKSYARFLHLQSEKAASLWVVPGWKHRVDRMSSILVKL